MSYNQIVQLRQEMNDSKLLSDDKVQGNQATNQITIDPQNDFEYKETAAEPKISCSKLTLIIIAPLLLVAHINIAKAFTIPLIQYSFVTALTAFVVNYVLIIRKHELMPYLPVESFDNRLKILCLTTLSAIIFSLYIGWNGSGGILFAIYWQVTRGSKMGIYGLFFGAIILGSIILENNYSYSKLVEFLPGMMLGYVNSELFKLKDSNTYAIAHQFIFLCSIGFPIFFPASMLIVPSMLQWVVMMGCGFLLLLTMLMTIKLMQSARVSVVMGITSGLLMMGTASYILWMDYVGLLLIGVGILMIIKKEFYDIDY